jgi:hypothetical protein
MAARGGNHSQRSRSADPLASQVNRSVWTHHSCCHAAPPPVDHEAGAPGPPNSQRSARPYPSRECDRRAHQADGTRCTPPPRSRPDTPSHRAELDMMGHDIPPALSASSRLRVAAFVPVHCGRSHWRATRAAPLPSRRARSRSGVSRCTASTRRGSSVKTTPCRRLAGPVSPSPPWTGAFRLNTPGPLPGQGPARAFSASRFESAARS